MNFAIQFEVDGCGGVVVAPDPRVVIDLVESEVDDDSLVLRDVAEALCHDQVAVLDFRGPHDVFPVAGVHPLGLYFRVEGVVVEGDSLHLGRYQNPVQVLATVHTLVRVTVQFEGLIAACAGLVIRALLAVYGTYLALPIHFIVVGWAARTAAVP